MMESISGIYPLVYFVAAAVAFAGVALALRPRRDYLICVFCNLTWPHVSVKAANRHTKTHARTCPNRAAPVHQRRGRR